MRAQTLARIAPAIIGGLVGSAGVSSAESLPRLGETGTSTGGRSSAEKLKNSLKDELREELKEELKAELKAELQQESSAPAPVNQEGGWGADAWKWEEPVKPELNFLELHGYFRFRYQLFNHLDLGTYFPGNGQAGTASGPFVSGTAPPTPLCNTNADCLQQLGRKNTLGGANMRLRLEPTLTVYEDIKVKMQWDLLDNLVLGSTPDGLPNTLGTPLIAFSRSQNPPSDGVNALEDSIRVKRIWGEVGTPLGQLRFGRMPSHFGMGILANEGRGLDADYGNTADRIMFITKIGDYYIAPAFDWVASGPTSQSRFVPNGQPFDRDQRDDVDQYVLAVAKRDKDEDIKQKLENDELVLNYGTYQVLRFQALDSADYYKDKPTAGAGDQALVRRDAQAWIYSVWAKMMWRKLTLEAEFAGIYGKIGNPVVGGNFSSSEPRIDLNQQGGVLDAQYKLLRDALTLELLVAFATGDSAYGWGTAPLSNGAPTAGDWDGSQVSGNDRKITNFRFDPGFYVDLILWRQLVGQITDALIFRPGIQYNFTEGFGLRLDLVYSRAWFWESTPSAARGPANADANLGLEGDVKVFLDSEDGFHAWLQYGMLIPFAGLNTQVTGENNTRLNLDAGIAHTIQALLAISF